jgi:hypothetical protein
MDLVFVYPYYLIINIGKKINIRKMIKLAFDKIRFSKLKKVIIELTTFIFNP